jgi:hypothetical protein
MKKVTVFNEGDVVVYDVNHAKWDTELEFATEVAKTKKAESVYIGDCEWPVDYVLDSNEPDPQDEDDGGLMEL